MKIGCQLSGRVTLSRNVRRNYITMKRRGSWFKSRVGHQRYLIWPISSNGRATKIVSTPFCSAVDN